MDKNELERPSLSEKVNHLCQDDPALKREVTVNSIIYRTPMSDFSPIIQTEMVLERDSLAF